MFESVTPPTPDTAPRQPIPPTTPLEIHTMPERFMGNTRSPLSGAPAPKKSGGNSKKLIIAIAIIVVVALGAGAALLFTGVLNKNAANTSNTNLVVNTPTTNVNANSNANVNTNANSNVNTNGNSNANTNANLNGNANSNGNSNSNANVNSNPSTPNSVDSDKDSLTDAEELILGTNPSVADSDSDGFLDGNEVKLGYNPKGKGKLVDSGLVSTFMNGLYGASVLYPKGWSASPRSSTEELFTNPAGDEFISFSVVENPARLTAKQWYVTQVPGIDVTSLNDITSWDGKSVGIQSLDGLAYYFANGSQIYVVSLSFGLKPTVDSRTTFEMLARSLVVDPTKVNLNANTNSALNLNLNTNSATNLNANTNSGTNLNTNSNTNANANR